MTNEKPNQNNKQNPEGKDLKNQTPDEKGGFGKNGNGKPEPTRYNDWEVDGRCSDF